ncbi:MAG: BadF/BadG/BcrA/BcrD ATPase family protein, partial [Blautia wexlerae]
MYYVGIDIGSTASEIASRLLDEGIDVMSEGVRVAATGYGRVAVDYADFVITEITCHGRGGRELAGNECAIIDVGGQDTKVILVDQGMIQDFLMNDKCSAGTGKFLEIMANRLGVTIAELFDLAEQMKSETEKWKKYKLTCRNQKDITTDEGMNRILKGIKLIRYGIFLEET